MSNAEADIFDSLSYVSRGGQKLAKALDIFGVSPEGKVCVDCGASTGGFTDCLLQRGARYVYAIDVGYGQLAWTLRNDPRVKVMERTNIRYVTPEMLTPPEMLAAPDSAPRQPETDAPNNSGCKPTLAVIDVSFISLSLVLPVVSTLTAADAEAVCLIKPQFEAGKDKVGKKGVVRDPATHEEVLEAFVGHAAASNFELLALSHSPVKGPKGNIEFLGHLKKANVFNASCGGIKDYIKAAVELAHRELDGQ